MHSYLLSGISESIILKLMVLMMSEGKEMRRKEPFINQHHWFSRYRRTWKTLMLILLYENMYSFAFSGKKGNIFYVYLQ